MKTIQELIQHKIEALDHQYPKAIPVFCGAIWVYSGDEFNGGRFIHELKDVAESAKFYGWHETPADAVRRFCRICMVDPALVEDYIGHKFEELYPEE